MEALVTSYLMMKNVEWRAHEEQEILVGIYSEIESERARKHVNSSEDSRRGERGDRE